jgi:hypothetical protein
MAVSRQRLVDELHRMGLPQAADQADRDLPDSVDDDQFAAFCERLGLDQGELMDRMGSSP